MMLLSSSSVISPRRVLALSASISGSPVGISKVASVTGLPNTFGLAGAIPRNSLSQLFARIYTSGIAFINASRCRSAASIPTGRTSRLFVSSPFHACLSSSQANVKFPSLRWFNAARRCESVLLSSPRLFAKSSNSNFKDHFVGSIPNSASISVPSSLKFLVSSSISAFTFLSPGPHLPQSNALFLPSFHP